MVNKKSYVPPPAVAREAKKGLVFREEYHRGGTLVGMSRGRQLASRGVVLPETIKRMYSYFARHEVDKKGKNFGNDEKPSNGYIAWLLWGGDAGKAWATKIRNELKKSLEK